MNKEIKTTVICPDCGKEVTVTVVSGNGSDVMTKESIEEIFSGMADLLVRKNRDYKGASFDLGLNGNMVHIWDKVTRYRNIVENPSMEINFESVEDTLKDIIGYAVIGLHILKAER